VADLIAKKSDKLNKLVQKHKRQAMKSQRAALKQEQIEVSKVQKQSKSLSRKRVAVKNESIFNEPTPSLKQKVDAPRFQQVNQEIAQLLQQKKADLTDLEIPPSQNTRKQAKLRQFAQLDKIDKSVLKSALQEKQLGDGLGVADDVGEKRVKANCLDLEAEVKQ